MSLSAAGPEGPDSLGASRRRRWGLGVSVGQAWRVAGRRRGRGAGEQAGVVSARMCK